MFKRLTPQCFKAYALHSRLKMHRLYASLFQTLVLLNEVSWVPCGIGHVRLLWDTSKYPRNVSLVSCWGICPESLFCERSNDSRFLKFPKDDGIEPVRMFLDILSAQSSLRFPMNSGILRSNLLLEISMAAKPS
ncbi:unnamed protein product [Prunus armeniaca]